MIVCVDRIGEIFERLSRVYRGEQEIELEYYSVYTLLVSTLLSAQATDKGVNKATKGLFAVADTPEKMLMLGESGLKQHIKSINYYNTKARHIIQLSGILVGKYNSNVPDNRGALESLPGVGRKTANIVLNIAFKQPNIAVDTHVFRVANRLGIIDAKNVRQAEEQLLKVVPSQYVSHVNHWFVLLGRYVCKAKKPDCCECFLGDICCKNIKQ